jgi:hypothetical protein
MHPIPCPALPQASADAPAAGSPFESVVMRCWRIDDAVQTLALASHGDRLPEIVYWGPPLPAGEDLAMPADAVAPDITGGMPDALLPLSICPKPPRAFLDSRASRSPPPTAPRSFPAFGSQDAAALEFRCNDADLGLTFRALLTRGSNARSLVLNMAPGVPGGGAPA